MILGPFSIWPQALSGFGSKSKCDFYFLILNSIYILFNKSYENLKNKLRDLQSKIDKHIYDKYFCIILEVCNNFDYLQYPINLIRNCNYNYKFLYYNIKWHT